MIHEHELREGNYILDLKGSIGIVSLGLGRFDVSTKQNGFSSAIYGSPIPLTPEILEKCEFKSIGILKKDENVYITDLFQYYKHTDGNIELKLSFSPEIDNILNISYIKYVHQLQNLYFALIGQELKITL